MRRKGIVFAGLLLIPVLAFSFKTRSSHGKDEAPAKKEKSEIEWVTFDKGIALAQKENKVLLVDFYTDWCHWCKVMDKETYGDQGIAKYASEKIIMAKVNAETNQKFKFKDGMYSGRELSMMFGVRGFPSTVFISPQGELITSISGFIAAEKFGVILKYLAEDWYEKMEFDEFEKQQNAKNKG